MGQLGFQATMNCEIEREGWDWEPTPRVEWGSVGGAGVVEEDSSRTDLEALTQELIERGRREWEANNGEVARRYFELALELSKRPACGFPSGSVATF